jgi:hypothetical protein
VAAGSEADLVVALRDALRAESQQLSRLGVEGRRLVEERHDVRKNASRLRQLFTAV